ncbi:hypothetical protein ACWF94_34180 [Streptomyces sp. NPDC055078]
MSYDFNEEEISRIAEILDLKYSEMTTEFLLFDSSDASRIRRRDVAIPVASAAAMVKALERGAERMEEYEGWVDPENGFAEFEVRMQALGPMTRTLEKFTFEIRPCPHDHQKSPPYEVIGDMLHPIMRVTSPEDSTCIEISRNSPLSPPLLPFKLDARNSRTTSTLKVFSVRGVEKSELEHRATALANSFLFELNARNRTAYTLRPRQQAHARRRYASDFSHSVRFPKTLVPKHVAALFSIPSEGMRNSHTSSFLSYYQILEYYLPTVHRRETVRKVRKVLRSLEFDEGKDLSILKVVSSVERAHGASEGDQLRALVNECVPEDKLREFFDLDHDGHFGKRGPISGVTPIHPASGESIASQVAKRVYGVRNRIVHAKDDARYAETSVLLPMSHEALRLYPDIELLRMLAIEVIVDNQ